MTHQGQQEESKVYDTTNGIHGDTEHNLVQWSDGGAKDVDKEDRVAEKDIR